MTRSAEPLRVSLLWAGPERADEIAALHQATFDDAWQAGSIALLLESLGATSLVATAADPSSPIGFVLGHIVAEEAELVSIGVLPEWRRRGVARALIEGLMRAGRRADAKRLHLEVAADNAAAIALYRSLGFAETRRRKGYYARPHPTPAVDALAMAIDL